MTLPVFTAMLLNGYWPLQLFIYARARKRSIGAPRTVPWQKYCLLGANAGAVTLLRSFGINYLSGSLYVIAANSEIVFTTLLSVCLDKDAVTRYQLGAVLLTILALAVSLYDPASGTFFKENPGAKSAQNFRVGFAEISRFLSALNSVLSSKLLGKDRKSRWGVMELSLFNSMVPSLLLPFVGFASGEVHDWGKELGRGWREVDYDQLKGCMMVRKPCRALMCGVCVYILLTVCVCEQTEPGNPLNGVCQQCTPGAVPGRCYYSNEGPSSWFWKAMFICTLVALCFAKFFDRMCKFTVVSLKSSMFYSVVDAGMKSAAGFGSFLFFNEHADWSDGVGFGLVLLSFVPMLYGDKLESQKKAGLEQSILEQSQPEEAEDSASIQ